MKRPTALIGAVVGLGLWAVLPYAEAGTIVVEGAVSWSADIDEVSRSAVIQETLGPGPGPALKKFLNINTPGEWNVRVVATNGSGQTWVGFHYDILFPPPAPSIPNDGVDFNDQSLPCATINLITVCRGTWTIMPDSLNAQFNQGGSPGVVRPNDVVSMGFGLTINSPPAQLPISFTLAEWYSVPEPSTWAVLAFGGLALLRTRQRPRRTWATSAGRPISVCNASN